MFLDGFAIAGYRSFGDAIQRFDQLAKLNFLIGPNNVGKSNALRFVHRHLPHLAMRQRGDFDWPADSPRSPTDAKLTIGLPVRLDSDRVVPNGTLGTKAWQKLCGFKSLSADGEIAWFYRQMDTHASGLAPWHPKIIGAYTDVYREALTDNEWEVLFRSLHPATRGGGVHDWIDGALAKIDPFVCNKELHDTQLVPAFRRIASGLPVEGEFCGAGLISRLAKLQNPSHDELALRKQFETINGFLRDVTGNPRAELEIPYERDTINVHMNDRVLPLHALGTGIHEVVIIAAACTASQKQIICLEEPELHLHPSLQRKLARYLAAETENQYFISTHSAPLIDVPSARIFRLQLVDGMTVVSGVTTSHARWVACNDLGYRASDVVQANCIIWVEGPSDRIYLNHWIRSISEDLVEGTHYSIMFYGGRLLSHLSVSDPEVTEFISLCALNRNSALIIDSDKNKKSAPLNATKSRLIAELHQKNLLTWVTYGREVENYLPLNLLREAVSAAAPGLGDRVSVGRYKKVLPCHGKRTVDKLKVAHTVSGWPAELGVYDLRERIKELVEFIRAAND